jgi:ComF family protein
VTALLDLVFPPFCPVCRQRLDDGRRDPLCGDCWEGLERIVPPQCLVCGVPFGGSPSGHASAAGASNVIPRRCGSCQRRPPPFHYARAAIRYEDIAREAVHALKFGGRRALAAPLGDLLAEMAPHELPGGAPHLVIPVPLHRRRERDRGFNQALLLARRLGVAWGIPVRSNVLVRTVPTPPQTELTATARRANVRGAFALRRPEVVSGRHVVLVDDILTTGSTVSACARCLRDAGAATIGVLTVARVI